MIDPEGLGSLSSVVEVMELRMAVEAEAAAIAPSVRVRRNSRLSGRRKSYSARRRRAASAASTRNFAFHDAIALQRKTAASSSSCIFWAG